MNMDIFMVGVVTLFAATAVFYIVLFSFIYYWHLVKVSFLVIPMVFAFEFFVIGFFTVAIVSIILEYVPVIIRAFGI